MKSIFYISTLAIATIPAMATAQEVEGKQEFSISTGIDYSSGDYGSTTDTDITYVPVTFKYAEDLWNAKLTIPYISIEGAGNVRPEVGNVAASNANRTTNSGLGDIVLSGTYAFYENFDTNVYGDVTAKVKFGTADENEGLGTGEMDYTLQFDFMKVIDHFTPMVGFGYKVLGDSSTIQLDNVWLWNVGFDYKVSDNTNVGMFYDWREKATSASKHQQDVSVYLSHKMNKHLKAQPYLGFGLSDGSPDANFGLMFTYTY
jgi:hypothetical protein